MAAQHTQRGTVVTASITDGALTLDFVTGQSLTIRPSQLSQEIRDAATLHGLKQKLVDAAALSRDPKTGGTASPIDKYSAVQAVYDRLLAGAWNAQRGGDGTGAGAAGGGLLYAALCRHYPQTDPTKLREWLAKQAPAQQASLRKNPAIAEIIETIKLERAARGTDAAGQEPGAQLLAELDELADL